MLAGTLLSSRSCLSNQDRKLCLAVVGCGRVAIQYAETLQPYPHLQLAAAYDLVPERAQAFAARFGGRTCDSLDDLLADDSIEVVVNLTDPTSHHYVTAHGLAAGKHVYSESPLALNHVEAWELVEQAERLGRRLCCAPVSFLGEAQQTVWRMIRQGRLGAVRVVYADVNWGNLEAWHPDPLLASRMGILFDAGVYPLTLLTAMFGPARRVVASAKILQPERPAHDGRLSFLGSPDFVVATIDLAEGVVARLTANSYVGCHAKQSGIEFHGDLGSLYLANWQEFDAAVEFAEFGSAYRSIPLVRAPYHGVEWGRALVEMADAIVQGRPQRATGFHAAHVLEVWWAIETSFKKGRPVSIKSSFTPPPPLEWAL